MIEKEHLNLIVPIYIPFTIDKYPEKILDKEIKHLFEDLNFQTDIIKKEKAKQPVLSIFQKEYKLKVYAIFIGENPYEFYFSKEKAEEKVKYLIAPDVKIIEMPYAFNS